MKQPVKHLDLPRYHLNGEHYVPPRARSSDEIERRHALPHGTLLLEQQRDGLAIVRHIVERAEDERDLAYIQDVLAACALNSSWYIYARDAEEMRRCLVSPDLFDPRTGQPRAATERRVDAEAHLSAVVESAGELVEAHVDHRLKPRQRFTTGRAVGTAALKVVTLSLDDTTYDRNPVDAAWARRERELETLGRARTLIGEVGNNPSVAQLPNPDSKFSGYVRRTATNNVYESFQEAVEELPNVA